MKNFLFTLLIFISSIAHSQHNIELCDEDTMKIFTYSTDAGVPGIYFWSVDGAPPVIDGSSYDVVWGMFGEGIHTITVEFEDGIGCPADPVTINVDVTICQTTTMWAPNCFTPDGDENNNIWSPVGYNYQEANYFIVNRWGQVIFESFNLAYGWDGTYQGKMCPDGVYLFVLDWKDYKGKRYTRQGHITLLR